MSARKPAAWADPDAEPDLAVLLAESGRLHDLTEGVLAQLASRICDAFEISDAPLPKRMCELLRLGEQQAGQGQKVLSRSLSNTATDILDSLTGCALSVRQLCEDTGRDEPAMRMNLHRLLQRRLVDREHRGGVYVYRATPLGRRLLREGR